MAQYNPCDPWDDEVPELTFQLLCPMSVEEMDFMCETVMLNIVEKRPFSWVARAFLIDELEQSGRYQRRRGDV